MKGMIDTTETEDAWIGVDLDGTLAHYDGWKGVDKIGKPIEKMQARVLKWLAAGEDVRIMTARASNTGDDQAKAMAAIKKWCKKHLGRELPVTNEKDMFMKELWDDRAIQVVPNTGERVDGKK